MVLIIDGTGRYKMAVEGKIEFPEITNKSGIHYTNSPECGKKEKEGVEKKDDDTTNLEMHFDCPLSKS